MMEWQSCVLKLNKTHTTSLIVRIASLGSQRVVQTTVLAEAEEG